MKHEKVIRPETVGQDFDEFLAEEGIAAEVEALAIKKVLVSLLENIGMTQAELARVSKACTGRAVNSPKQSAKIRFNMLQPFRK